MLGDLTRIGNGGELPKEETATSSDTKEKLFFNINFLHKCKTELTVRLKLLLFEFIVRC